MAISAKDVMELRNKTGVGMTDCKTALENAGGNMEKAIELLREKGMASAAKRSGRTASNGVVDSYIHMGNKVGVLVEVNCETDFAAKSEAFRAFVHDVTLQIAAHYPYPLFVTKAQVPAEIIEAEKKVIAGQIEEEAKASGKKKPEAIIAKIVDGRIEKYYKDFCLMNQDFVKNPDITVTDLLNELTAKIGEKIEIRRFVRYELCEEL